MVHASMLHAMCSCALLAYIVIEDTMQSKARIIRRLHLLVATQLSSIIDEY